MWMWYENPTQVNQKFNTQPQIQCLHKNVCYLMQKLTVWPTSHYIILKIPCHYFIT